MRTNSRGQRTTTKIFSPPSTKPNCTAARKKSTGVGENRPFKDGRERKLCRKKSRSWKSWFEGKTDKEQCHALLPLVNNEQKGHLERRQRRKRELTQKHLFIFFYTT